MSAAQLLSSITTIQWLSHVRVLVKSSPSEQRHWGWDCLGERESKWGGRYCKNGVVMRVQVDFYFKKSKLLERGVLETPFQTCAACTVN